MRKVIYTVLTGNYDILMQPKVVDTEFDYICFSDCMTQKWCGVWKVRPIPFHIDDGCRLSRWPKMHPHILFPEYDYSLYLDANVVIISQEFYNAVNRKIESGSILAGIKHFQDDCTYNECFKVFWFKRENSLRTIKQEFQYLRGGGLPEHYGMYEANVILRKHHTPVVIRQCEEWWYMLIRFSKRDQLSYSFTLMKNNIDFDYILPAEECHNRGLGYYEIVKHETSPKVNSHGALWQKICRRLFYHYMEC